MEGKGDGGVVGDLGEFLDVLDVGAANVGVGKHGIAIAVLAFDEIVEIRADVLQSFGQAGLFRYRIDGEIDGGDSGVSQAVRYFRPKKACVGRQVDPKIILRCVVHDFVDEIGTQERLAAGRGKHAARR